MLMLTCLTQYTVMPAQAGTHASLREDHGGANPLRYPSLEYFFAARTRILLRQEHLLKLAWVPAFAGMTSRG